MAIPIYLAMTAAEISHCEALPSCTAWMSCHFSPSGQGLCNLPGALPENALLVLDDQMPPDGHDCSLIRRQLLEAWERYPYAGLLLDFQRPNNDETARILRELLSLPFPVCVSHLYAREHRCPVFLPPCPLTQSVSDYLSTWHGREIWLETAPERAAYQITKTGCRTLVAAQEERLPFRDETLFFHYRIHTAEDHILFTLERTRSDLDLLLEAAAAYGVTTAVGLYQELRP